MKIRSVVIVTDDGETVEQGCHPPQETVFVTAPRVRGLVTAGPHTLIELLTGPGGPLGQAEALLRRAGAVIATAEVDMHRPVADAELLADIGRFLSRRG